MHLIKLDAIDSTNDFVKILATNQQPKNYTVVTAETQTNGRGQMGATWQTQSGKNLITSVFVKDSVADASLLPVLNFAVAISVYDAIQEFAIPEPAIKWPNDIMSGNKKIGGILIENSIKNKRKIHSIIGIGINVNQTAFDNLPKASSMCVAAGREFDRDALLQTIVAHLKSNILKLKSDADAIVNYYNRNLFKKNVPMAFESDEVKFMGIIRGVDLNGRLIVELENDQLKTYSLKEITMLY